MSEHWRKPARTAFRFWEQVLTSRDETPGHAGQYTELIAHLKQFEKRTSDTFKHVLTRGADPVYLLHVLIATSDEQRVHQAVGMPQLFTQSRSGSLADLRDFHLVTDTDLRTMEAAAPALRRAGQPVDQEFLQSVRTRFEAMPEPPDRDGYIGEKASLWTTFTSESPSATPPKGRPGEHWFNTGMVLLARHLIQTGSPRGARYTSIALLLNAFCPDTYGPSALNKDLVRHRITHLEERVTHYCEHFERWFQEWKRILHHHPVPFYPWHD